MVSRILSGLSADILLMVSCSTWAHISRKLHSCTTAANALLQQLLWQAIPFGLAGQCVEAVRHLHAQASHIEIIINVRHCTLQAVCKLLRRLLPWHLWPASLLTPAKPRRCSLVEEDICHIGQLCMCRLEFFRTACACIFAFAPAFALALALAFAFGFACGRRSRGGMGEQAKKQNQNRAAGIEPMASTRVTCLHGHQATVQHRPQIL